jgi:hypothetical protein
MEGNTMIDQVESPESDDLSRRITSSLLAHAGAAMIDIARLLRKDTDGPHGADCDCEDEQDSPRVAEFTWESRFASEVGEHALLALDGRHVDESAGLRVMRVTRRRETERSGMFGSGEAITFLLLDLDSDKPHSLTASPDAPLQVAVEVPESAASLTGGVS